MSCAVINISIVTAEGLDEKYVRDTFNSLNKDPRQVVMGLAKLLNDGPAGITPIEVAVTVDRSSGRSASVAATVTDSSVVENTDILTLEGVAHRCVANPNPTLGQWGKLGTDAATKNSLVAAINCGPANNRFLAIAGAGGALQIYWKSPGIVGNGKTASETGSGISLGASALSGGADPGGMYSQTVTIADHSLIGNNDTIVVAGQTITWKSSGADPANGEVNIGADADGDAENLAATINQMRALDGVAYADVASVVVTVGLLQRGLAGACYRFIDNTGGGVTMGGVVAVNNCSESCLGGSTKLMDFGRAQRG